VSDQQASPKVSILIVGYNTKELVADCLRTVYQHTQGVDFEVVFVDCSNDGSAEMLASDFSQVRVIDNTENLGFGRGNNFVARHARGTYLLLLNPDTLLRDNAIGELVALADAQPEAGAWGGVTELADGSIDPGSQQTGPGLRYAFFRMLGLRKLGTGGLPADATQPGDVGSLSGAFMMVRRDVWEQLGGFDESFFMYCEETDLCQSIRSAGYRVLMTPNARITHLVGGGAAENPKRMIAMCKGAMHLNRKHFGALHTLCEGMLRWTHSFTRYAAGVVLTPLKPDKATRLRARHQPIVFHPRQWWGGWAARPASTAEQPKQDVNSSPTAMQQGDAA